MRNSYEKKTYTLGLPGETGPTGMGGLPGPSAYIISRHSQSSRIPACPAGSVKLWDGYSLLHTEDDGRAATQDLGKNTAHIT